MKKIGIIGSGIVAKTLASGFVKHGYHVMIGSRDKAKHDELEKLTGAKAGTFEEAAAFGEMNVLSVKGLVAESVIASLTAQLAGKTVIDTSNPIAELPPDNGVIHFFTTFDSSLMERLQKKAPEVNFVKAFSCVGSHFMIDPKFESKPTMFICGNNANAKKDVVSLLDKIGWETEDMGFVEAARAIEPLCMLWCIPGMRENRWNHAFKLLKSK